MLENGERKGKKTGKIKRADKVTNVMVLQGIEGKEEK